MDTLKEEWLADHDIGDLTELMAETAASVFSFMDTVFIETKIIPDFKANINYGVPILEVEFGEISQHNPEFTAWEWDFDEDGITDAFEQNANWNYTVADSFDVSLTVTNADSTFTFTKQNFIQVFDSATDIIDVNPDSLAFLTFEDTEGLDLTITNLLDIPTMINDISLDNVGSFYSLGCDMSEFPIFLAEGDSIILNIILYLTTEPEREVLTDTLRIDCNGSIYPYPIYVDESLNCDAEDEELQITNYELQNFPNPFNPSTTISFSLNAENSKDTELVIYNTKGQKVDLLKINNEDLRIGEVVWDAKGLSSGIYFYKLVSSGKTIDTKRMILLK